MNVVGRNITMASTGILFVENSFRLSVNDVYSSLYVIWIVLEWANMLVNV